MKFIGAHVSTQGGVENAPPNAARIGARAFALFTKNQRQWVARPLTAESVTAFTANCKAAGFAPQYILPHAGYLINLGNPEKAAFKKSFDSFMDEMQRCEQLGLTFLNLHPGTSLGKMSDTECLKQIAEAINAALEQTSGVSVIVENTAGQGSCVGWRFEHLAEIIAQIKDKSRIGICFDTAHAFGAGYDLSSPKAYEKTMAELESVIGFAYVKAMHINDSKAALGSRVDRHEILGKGQIGLAAFKCIMKDERWNNKPLILETIDESLWPQEIAQLYGFAGKTKKAAL